MWLDVGYHQRIRDLQTESPLPRARSEADSGDETHAPHRADDTCPADLQAKASPLSRIDTLCMLAGLLLSLGISYVLSHKRIFWEDELLGWMLLRDPSWRHMIAGWKLGADGGGFGFYLIGRCWFYLFGPSEVSLRMYSAACLGFAFVVLWATARRFYETTVVFFALYNTWFFSTYIVVHMAEGRYYGLLTLSAALVTWLTVVPTRRPGRTLFYLYPLTFLLHALLTTSHQLGIVFSAFLLASMALLDWMSGRIRPVLYACALAAWLLLLPEREAITNSARVGKPHFWTTAPSFSNFVGAYTGFSAEVATVLLVLGLALVFSLWRSPQNWREALLAAYRTRRPVWVITLAFLLIPIAYLAEGKFGIWLFVNRYLLPVTIGQVFLTAEAVCLIDWDRFSPAILRGRLWTRPIAAACFSVVLLFWVFGRLKMFVIPPDNYTDALTAMLPQGVPVVCEDAWSFAELIGRQHNSGVDYSYLLDWPYAVDPAAPLLEVTQFHLMENWKKAGYFSGSIMYRDDFLKKNDRFLVVRAEPEPPGPPTIGNPLIDRFAHTPGYDVRPFGVLHRFHFRDAVYLVCHGSCQNTGTPQLAKPIERFMSTSPK